MADNEKEVTLDEFIHAVQKTASDQGFPDATLRAADAFVRATCTVLGDIIAEKKSVAFPKLFSIAPQWRAERQGHNPQTCESMTIPAQWKVKLKLSTDLKARLNG